ncbi:RmlC-like jelly roll fold [Moorella glycerini]|uniref:Cupin type-2 domain-containing protein n=1 Tax=Neomoorella stamsii TaxID=1266720 RepID=A0A9X7J3N0_9FIRM|nr:MULTISPECIES: cupin domain-containing protein [Moorella]PRR73409.1 hypothetical protein MOST_12570 [Moorella stamsii]CEP69178.1 RmlC-like jelly roll fold [Moorella glycerini]
MIKVLHVNRDYVTIPIVDGGEAKAIVWPGMGAKNCALHYVVMKPGQENIPHVHRESEDIIFVVQGRGVVVDLDNGKEYEFEPGSVIYIPPGIRHTVKCFGPDDYIVVGAQSPFDMDLYRRAGLVKDE